MKFINREASEAFVKALDASEEDTPIYYKRKGKVYTKYHIEGVGLIRFVMPGDFDKGNFTYRTWRKKDLRPIIFGEIANYVRRPLRVECLKDAIYVIEE